MPTQKSTSAKSTSTARKPRRRPSRTASTKETASTATADPESPTTPKRRTPAHPKDPVVVANTTPISLEPELKKQELIEKVVLASGAKKREVKPIVEAMLRVLGDALSEGRALNLEPLGKTKITRVKDAGTAKVSVLRLRQRAKLEDDAEKDGQEPLAQPAQ